MCILRILAILIQKIMLKNYIWVAFRNFWKQKQFTFFHVTGLTLGLTCSFLIFLFVHFHLSTDTFYPHAHRIYRVVLDMHIEDGSIEYESGSSLPMAKALKNEFALIEQAGFCMSFYRGPTLSIQRSENETARYVEHTGVAYGDTGFLQIFDYQFIEGDPQTALAAPNQAVLTEKQATKYFGHTDVLGETIRINDRADLAVTGVIKDYPENTDFKTDVWVSLPTLKTLQPTYQTENFTWIGYNNWTFVQLSGNNEAASINLQLPDFVNKYLGDDFQHWHFHLQPLGEMHFDTRYGGVIRKPLLWILSTVAVFIILIACINFINLSTAQALSRVKEVGVRKALGSSRKQLFWQFIIETSLLVWITLGITLVTITLCLPWLNEWVQTRLSLQQWANPAVIFFMLLLIFAITLLAGGYPAFLLSGYHPIKALKGKVNMKETGGYRLRKVLVTTQFAISQAFIIAAFIVLYQMDYFRQTDTGFRKDAMITITVPGNDYSNLETFRNQLKQHPEIQQVSFHHSPPMGAINEGGYVKFNNSESWEPFLVRDRWADAHYLETYDLELIAGRNLIMRDAAEFLVNEEFVKKLGVASPEDVLDKPLLEGNAGVEGVIVGVVKDFHHNSLQNPIEPVVIYPYPGLFRQAGIQLQTYNLQQTLEDIRAIWSTTFPDQVFEYEFLDETLAQLYEKEQIIARLTRIFTVVAILICCLGLLGLATYTARQRTKEIGVRKVLGASVPNILLLLSKDYIQLILIAFVIAMPIANYFMSEWLQNFAYRIEISWWMFVIPGLLVLLIALLSVSGQTVKAARQNPVDSLRNE